VDCDIEELNRQDAKAAKKEENWRNGDWFLGVVRFLVIRSSSDYFLTDLAILAPWR
jgi:hypothetical protein